VKRSVDLLT